MSSQSIFNQIICSQIICNQTIGNHIICKHIKRRQLICDEEIDMSKNLHLFVPQCLLEDISASLQTLVQIQQDSHLQTMANQSNDFQFSIK